MLQAFSRWFTGRGRAERLLSEGRAAEARGDFEAARQRYRAASAAAPRSAAPHLHLGVLLEARGDGDGAFACFRAALAAEPGSPFARYNLGKARFMRGETEGAEADLCAALAARPEFAEAHAVLGILYCGQERWDEAAAALSRAAAQNPADAVSRSWLGSLLVERGRREEARRYLGEALALAPGLAHAHVGLGNMHATERDYAAAATCYRRAVTLDPGDVQAHVNLASALAYMGESKQARDCCDAALALDPENAAARWIRVMAAIPAVRDASEDLATLRARFREELRGLAQWFASGRAVHGHRAVGIQQPFWLAYQDADNVELLQTYGRLCAGLMSAWQARAGLGPLPPESGGALRIAVISQYFRRHAVWDAMVRGWFEALDRSRFELHAFHLGTLRDEETEFAQARAARFHQGPRTLTAWVEALRATRPHAILYPELGMDPMTLKLASLRLAPLQIASWGHPETTGLPTIDFFLSARALEPDAPQAHYAEELVLLPGPGCLLEPEPAPQVCTAAPDWDLPADAPLLLCPGTPYKYAPEHDLVLTAIARTLGRCCLVFFTSRQTALAAKLRHRLEGHFAREGLELDRFARFLPWLPRAEFHALMRRADAMLDTIGFSGFNTALQAIGCGLPVVGYEGRFLRGRLASGLLRYIGMGELVAGDTATYVDLAVRLARDASYRDEVRQRLERGRHVLYGDAAPVRALERFLENALAGYSSDSR